MGFLDVLRKLGILRAGAEKAVYHNAKERPMSFQADGVFNSSKDVIDLDKRPATAKPPAAPVLPPVERVK
jgi:hypothetical protein